MLAMRTADFDFELPPELIAQEGIAQRDQARLMVLAGDGTLSHKKITELPDLFREGDMLVLNDTRVLKARLIGKKEQPLELRLESDAVILGAESELRSAFSNLVINALKYVPEAGSVWVRWRDDAGGAVLEVEDNGPGIAAEHLPRLTERFYRVETGKSGGKDGVGLGLSIVKHVMTRHEGELKIASAWGKGSCFSCRFPERRLLRNRL